MPDDEDIDAETRRLLQQAFAGVKPLPDRQRRVVFDAPPPSRKPPPPVPPVPQLTVERSGERVEGRAPDVALALLRQLGKGDLPVEATVDLHGRTGDQAERTLRTFLATCRSGRRRIVLVICGRGLGSGPGGPVVKERVIDALTRAPLAGSLLAFTSAPARLGGTGALLLALRTERQTPPARVR